VFPVVDNGCGYSDGVTKRSGLAAALFAAVSAVSLVAGCSEDNGPAQPGGGGAPTDAAQAKHGPFFPECGGISDQTVAQLTQVSGVVGTAKNPGGCVWLVNGGILGPHFSFTWYRGSPIGRERKTEELTRASTEDITIEGHSGFIAKGSDVDADNPLCEIGIQFDDDFIEWSISFASKPFPDPCDVAKELTKQSIVNSK